MAFTRNFLKSLSLSDEQVQAVIEEHVAVVDGLKKYKEDAEKLPSVQKELDDLKKQNSDAADWKKKYEDEHSAFESYKSDADAKAVLDKKKQLYTELLKETKVGEKQIEAILRVTDFDSISLTKDGKLDGREKLGEAVKKEWGGFIVTTSSKGEEVQTPPDSSKGGSGENAAYIRSRGQAFHSNLYGGGTDEKKG